MEKQRKEPVAQKEGEDSKHYNILKNDRDSRKLRHNNGNGFDYTKFNLWNKLIIQLYLS